MSVHIRRDVSSQEAVWALNRRPDRTYFHATFTLRTRGSRDYRQPARYVVKVFDEITDSAGASPDLELEEAVVHSTPGGRKQIKLQVARQAGDVREIQLERVVTTGGRTTVEQLLTLDRDGAGRLIDLV